MRVEIKLTDQGYLHLSADLAQRYFPEDVLVVLVKTPELWLLPLRGASAGGLLLKQRNLKGDRSVLIWEHLPEGTPSGRYPAFWDDTRGALRIALASTAHE
ncbi:MAG: hydrogenase maturation protease [Anaerolineaceae bacterium]|nr:hydrogenase maturation protease [Anaerolineaceae bacterium]